MSPIATPPVGSVVFFQGRDLVAQVIKWTTLPLGVYIFVAIVLIGGSALAWQTGMRLTWASCTASAILGLTTLAVLILPSKPTHVGIIANMPTRDGSRRTVLVEAVTQCKEPCLYARDFVRGVQMQEYENRIVEYDGRVWMYQPRDDFTEHDSDELAAVALSEMGKEYTALGAMASARRITRWFKQSVFNYSSAKRWCSKLVVILLKEVDRYHPGKHSNRSPAQVERDLLQLEKWDYVEVRR